MPYPRGKAIVTQEAMMEVRGYVTPQKAADMAGRHLITMYGWMRDKKVYSVLVGSRRYVQLKSLYDYLGPALFAQPTP